MPRTRIQFLGPKLHPIGKWIFAFCYLIAWAIWMFVGIVQGFPEWLRIAGFGVWGLFLVASSIWILYLRANRRRRHELLRRGPRGFWRWYLDDYHQNPGR